MDFLIVKACFPHDSWFPETNVILSLLPFTVIILAGVGVAYRNWRIGYLYYLINTVVYSMSWLFRDFYFKSYRPNPFCVVSNNARVFDISKYGFPDAGRQSGSFDRGMAAGPAIATGTFGAGKSRFR